MVAYWRQQLFGSVRRQLIIGVALVHAVMMALFIADVTLRQRQMLLERQVEQAQALAQTLATSAAGWLAARDISGLQEIAEAQRRYPELTFAMLLDPRGQILAHTDRSRLGFYVRDLPAEQQLKVISRSAALVDVVNPVMLRDHPVGWVRVGIGQHVSGVRLKKVTRDGFLYALGAIITGSILAWLMGTHLTNKLYAVRRVSEAVRKGRHNERVPDLGTDEAGCLGRDFNAMLEALSERESELACARDALARSEERFDLAMRGANDGLWDWDLGSEAVYYSPRWKAMIGYREHEIGVSPDEWLDRIHPDDRPAATAALQRLLQGETELYEISFRFRHRDGHWLHVLCRGTAVRNEEGAATRIVGTLTDVTERKAAEEKIRSLAYYDPLTALPNRRMLLDRLRLALAFNARGRLYGALLFIDLDNFKILNDTLGHKMGDLLLVAVAQRLQSCLRKGDMVARLGGDEFIVMLEHLDDSEERASALAAALGEKILNVLREPFSLAGRAYHSTPSVGVTLFREQNETPDDLLKRADLAMYQAKAAGRNTLRFFDPAMQAALEARSTLEAEIREALRRNEFVLHFQPQVDRRGRIIGAEALVRWQHPERGLLLPGHFIPVAEETGLILPLGQWVLEQACDRLANWASDPATARLTLAANVSAKQFRRPHFEGEVASLLDASGARPEHLKLEITESLLVQDMEDASSKMEILKRLGVKFSLDDFGTGYSSLSYLKQLPLDQVKIDRSFVRDLLTDANDAALVRAIIAMADSLGLSVVAEGVESAGQWSFLLGEGCHEGQGYLFSPPLPLEEFMALLGNASHSQSSTKIYADNVG